MDSEAHLLDIAEVLWHSKGSEEYIGFIIDQGAETRKVRALPMTQRTWAATNVRATKQDDEDYASPRRLAVSEDGRFLCVASRDSRARVFHTLTGKLLHTLELDQAGASVAISPRGEVVVAGTIGSRKDATVPVQSNLFAWSLMGSTATPLWKAQQQGAGDGIVIHPDGTWCAVISGYGRLHFFDLRTGAFRRVCTEIGNGFGDVALSSDGRTLITAGQSLRFWEPEKVPMPRVALEMRATATDEQSQPFVRAKNGAWARLVAMGLDRTWAAVIGGYDDPAGRAGTLARFDASTGQVIAILARELSEVTCMTLSLDGRLVALGFESARVEIRLAETGALVRVLDMGSFGNIRSIAFLERGRRLALTNRHGTRVEIRSVIGGERVREWAVCD